MNRRVALAWLLGSPPFAAVVDKVLRGADPARLPFEQPSLSRLVVNLLTARSLGLVVPREIQLRADRVVAK